jgi:hypothetical protein
MGTIQIIPLRPKRRLSLQIVRCTIRARLHRKARRKAEDVAWRHREHERWMEARAWAVDALRESVYGSAF